MSLGGFPFTFTLVVTFSVIFYWQRKLTVLSQCDDAGDNTQCLSIAGDCSPGRLGIVGVANSNAIPSLVLSTQ